MKKIKVPADFLKSCELSQILLPIADHLKSLSNVVAAFEKSIVVTADSGKPIVDPFAVVAALKSTRQVAITSLPSLEHSYEALRRWAIAESENALAAFHPQLSAFCEIQGFKLDGRYPRYLIDGFLAVRVDEKAVETQIGASSAPSLLIDVIAPMISEQVRQERARKFDSSLFLELLHRAYERCLLLAHASFGDPIPVRKVYEQVVSLQQSPAFLKSGKKSLFQEYTVEVFTRDLARLLDSGACQTKDGKMFSDRPTSFAAEGIPIVQRGQARIIGKIVFSPERH